MELVKVKEEFKNIQDGKSHYIISSLSNRKVDRYYLEMMGITGLEIDYRVWKFKEEYKIPSRDIWCIKDDEGLLSIPFNGGRNNKTLFIADFEPYDTSLSYFKNETLYIPSDFFKEEIYFTIYRDCTDNNEYLFQVNNLKTVKVDNLKWNERILISVDKDLNLEVHKVESQDLSEFWKNIDKNKVWLSNRKLKPSEDYFLVYSDDFWIKD